MRVQVHTSPRKPYASAPAANISSKSSQSPVVSRGGAPDRGRGHNPASPYSCTLAIHWLTAPLVTPKASAIRCCFQPCCFRTRARHRRASCQSAGLENLIAIPATYHRQKSLGTYATINSVQLAVSLPDQGTDDTYRAYPFWYTYPFRPAFLSLPVSDPADHDVSALARAPHRKVWLSSGTSCACCGRSGQSSMLPVQELGRS